MQKLTTKEPTSDMAVVAIKAVVAVFDWRAFLGYEPEAKDLKPEAPEPELEDLDEIKTEDL